MKRFLFLFLFVAACSQKPVAPPMEAVAPAAPSTPVAAETPPPAAAEIDALLKTYSIDQLSQAANYLLARAENDKNHILKCDPSAQTAMQWSSGQLRALIDEKLSDEKTAYQKAPASFAKRIKGCSRTCTCTSYALLLEQVEGPVVETKEHKQNAKLLKGEIKLDNVKKTLKCAKDAQWFCGSRLETYLKKD